MLLPFPLFSWRGNGYNLLQSLDFFVNKEYTVFRRFWASMYNRLCPFRKYDASRQFGMDIRPCHAVTESKKFTPKKGKNLGG